MERGIMLKGNGQAPVHMYWKKLLKIIQSGELEPLHMVSHRVLLEELDTVYMKFDKRMKGIQKVFVQTKFSDPPCQGSPELTRFR
jgi:threonine dehydrogenase-like Zn-dependent dehydrogenase